MNREIVVKQQAHAMGTKALHAAGGDKHLVAVKALHVLLCPDDDGWFAQGLEIDYAATGDSVEAVKHNFAHGLALTVHEHLKVHGEIGKLLKIAPQEAWQEYLSATPDSIKQTFTTVQFHSVVKEEFATGMLSFPFDDILFVESLGATKGNGSTEAACA